MIRVCYRILEVAAVHVCYETKNEYNVAAVRKDHVAVGKLWTAARRLHVGQVLDKLRTKGRTFVRTFVQHMP